MHSAYSVLADYRARGTPHPAQIQPERCMVSCSDNLVQPLKIYGWVFLRVENKLSLVSELQLLDRLLVFSKHCGLEASSNSLHFYSAFHPIIPSNAFIFYHSNVFFPSCINNWKQMLTISITILAVTCLKDDCFLILIFLYMNPMGPFMLVFYFLSNLSRSSFSVAQTVISGVSIVLFFYAWSIPIVLIFTDKQGNF